MYKRQPGPGQVKSLLQTVPDPHGINDHLRIQMCIRDSNNAVSGDLEHSVIGGIELAEIPGIEYGLEARIVRAQAPDDIPGAVCGIIINEYQLIVCLLYTARCV